MIYKKHSEKTKLEKQLDKWIKKGRPVMFWNGGQRGPYVKGAQNEEPQSPSQ